MEEEIRNLSKSVCRWGALIWGFIVLLSSYAWLELPDSKKYPVHWGASGLPDRFGSKTELLLTAPIITLAMLGLLVLVPRWGKPRANVMRSGKAFRIISILIFLVLLLIHAGAILTALGWKINMSILVTTLSGVVITVCGNYLPKTGPNCLIGIRTRSTLKSEKVWFKTHRRAGPIFMIFGLALILSAFLPPACFGAALFLIFGAFACALLYLIKYAKDLAKADA
jgi:uncharacterized membrane protein